MIFWKKASQPLTFVQYNLLVICSTIEFAPQSISQKLILPSNQIWTSRYWDMIFWKKASQPLTFVQYNLLHICSTIEFAPQSISQKLILPTIEFAPQSSFQKSILLRNRICSTIQFAKKLYPNLATYFEQYGAQPNITSKQEYQGCIQIQICTHSRKRQSRFLYFFAHTPWRPYLLGCKRPHRNLSCSFRDLAPSLRNIFASFSPRRAVSVSYTISLRSISILATNQAGQPAYSTPKKTIYFLSHGPEKLISIPAM